MSFQSNNVDDYLNIYQNPALGLKYLEKHEKNDNELNDNKSDNDNDSEIDSGNESENEFIDLEKEEIINDNINNDQKIHNNDVELQILDIDFYHVDDDDDINHFNMMLFGKTKEDKSVYVNIEGFTPYFYVEVDANWKTHIIQNIVKDVQKSVYPTHLQNGLKSHKVIKAHKFHGFTEDEEFNFLHIVFHDFESMRAYARAFEKKHTMLYVSRHRKIAFKVYESNIHPILRFLHMQNLDPIGWCKISKDKFKQFEYNQRKGQTDININCHWKDVQPVVSNDIHKFKILSFDIECDSEDGKFPCNREGDAIIQIGMTYSNLGDAECFKKVVLCLKQTANISNDCIVKCYTTEKKLMLAFTDEIRKEDPDIITGYNIFGFDFDYMMNRSKKLGIYTQFSRFSRIKGHVCKYMEQKLQSHAMGHNNLKYYHTPGRICIDLMKVIQREHKLSSYTLDNVAASFIRDDIVGFEYVKQDDDTNEKNSDAGSDDQYDDDDNDCYSSDEENNDEDEDDIHINKKKYDSTKMKIKKTKLKVKSTFGINKGDYIAVYYNDGPTDNIIGKKRKVIDIDDKTITLCGKVRIRPYLDKKWEVFWCQAKDDVGPKDIFRLYRGNDKDRAIVAKYCLKDCSLCNRLIEKLQILPNNIGMGNVCCVPLSYLFLRGQSVKIFSLVSKECRLENYLIPNNKKKLLKILKDANGNVIENQEQKEEKTFQKFINSLINNDDDDDDDEDEGYEGATVFDPIKGVHYEPIIVGDYSSLYPSSMIMKNLSHNSIVLDSKYDNRPGYKYHEQCYNKPDGTTARCRFAEKIDGTKATIPRILKKLLDARKIYNNLKSEETDVFKKAVWDGLQLAYKITANSLYGQCGSSISPIAMKAIAACTTSIGRNMLELARHFVENEMKTIIELIKIATDEKNEKPYLDYMNTYYIDVPDEKVIGTKDELDSNGKSIKINGKPKKVILYQGKDNYFKWVKNEIYSLIGQYTVDPKCIYGDTDSVFFKLNLADKDSGQPFKTHESLKISIKMGILTTGILNYTLSYPQALAYEKVYWPFIIITKKRYVGNLYSYDPNEYYQKSMGLVTKRRDNADIVKVVVGGIIDQILNHRSPIGAVKFTKSRLMKIITGKYQMDKFIITRTLKDKEHYADWTSMAHVVLADRMAQRDPGNKPQSNDRIPFVYIETETTKKKILQGERIEYPKYIIDNNLKIDYLFYITNQILKPSMQFLELIVHNPKAIFKMYTIREENRKNGTDPIMKYYAHIPTDQGNVMSVNLQGSKGDALFGESVPINVNRKRITKREKVMKKLV